MLVDWSPIHFFHFVEEEFQDVLFRGSSISNILDVISARDIEKLSIFMISRKESLLFVCILFIGDWFFLLL